MTQAYILLQQFLCKVLLRLVDSSRTDDVQVFSVPTVLRTNRYTTLGLTANKARFTRTELSWRDQDFMQFLFAHQPTYTAHDERTLSALCTSNTTRSSLAMENILELKMYFYSWGENGWVFFGKGSPTNLVCRCTSRKGEKSPKTRFQSNL